MFVSLWSLCFSAGVSLGATWWMYSCQHITFVPEGSLIETEEERFWWWINESRQEFVNNLFLASISNSHELLISQLDFPSLFLLIFIQSFKTTYLSPDTLSTGHQVISTGAFPLLTGQNITFPSTLLLLGCLLLSLACT